MRGIVDYELERIERYGGRCSEKKRIGKCERCRQELYTSDAELCFDKSGNNFCSLTCFLKFYEYKEGWSEKQWQDREI